MLAIIKSFLTANVLRILAIVLSVMTIAGILLGVRNAGRNAEKVDQLKRQIDDVKEAEAIRRGVADDYRSGARPKRVQKFDID